MQLMPLLNEEMKKENAFIHIDRIRKTEVSG